MSGTVCTGIYAAPPIKQNDILRYASAGEDSPETLDLLQSCLCEAEGRLAYKVCYKELEIHTVGDSLDLGFATVSSSALKKNLDGCDRIVLFAATVGVEIDRLIYRYSSVFPSRSLMLQAIGAERIESLCDAFCAELAEIKSAEGYRLRPRFSPGYGDLPLELQRDIFGELDCPRKIGLSLNQSLLMSPSKSVTAIVGLCSKNIPFGRKI